LIVGVLEVFSPSVHAFTDEHVAFLSRIAGLLESTLSSQPEARVFVRTPIAPDVSWAVELLRANISEAHAGWWRTPKWRYGSIAGALVLIGLLFALSWRFWYPSFHDTVAGSPNSKAGPKANLAIPREGLNPSQRIDPDRFVGTRDKTGLPKLPLALASQKDLDDEPIVRRFGTTAAGLISGPSNGSKQSASEPLNEPPEIPVSRAHSEALFGVIASSAPMPSLDLPVSQGVRPLLLERRMMPRYPAQARALKLEGTVIVEAWVNERGRVDQVSLVSGSPELGQAAIEAVREWRYRPALLNGKPVRTETQITITFQASTTR
jgi:TonB family protein